MKTDKKLVEDERPTKTIQVDVDATICLDWIGGEVELTVPEDADEHEIKKQLMNYLMSPEAMSDWIGNDPEIADWQVVGDESESESEDDEDRE